VARTAAPSVAPSIDARETSVPLGGSRAGRLLLLGWLVFLGYPISNLLHSSAGHLRVALSLMALAAFLCVYLSLDVAADSPSPIWAPLQDRRGLLTAIGAMTAVAFALTAFDGPAWLSLYVFVAVSAGARLPTRVGLRLVAVTGGLVVLTSFAVRPRFHIDSRSVASLALLSAGVGYMAVMFRRLRETNASLQAARDRKSTRLNSSHR